jgi:hypothetical protein
MLGILASGPTTGIWKKNLDPKRDLGLIGDRFIELV